MRESEPQGNPREDDEAGRPASSPGGFEVLFEANPLPILVYDPDSLRVLAVNRAATRVYGYERDEFLELTIADLRPPEDVPLLREHLQRRRRGDVVGGPSGLWRHCTKGGTLLWVEIDSHAIPFRDSVARLAVARDVTEQIEARRELELRERRFRAMIEHAFEGIALIDEQRRVVFVSPSSTAVHGHPVDTMEGRDRSDLVHPDDAPRIDALLEELHDEPGATRRLRYRFRHADGRWLWLEGVFTNLLDEPAVDAFTLNVRDVTARVEEARERERRSAQMARLAAAAGRIQVAETDDALGETVLAVASEIGGAAKVEVRLGTWRGATPREPGAAPGGGAFSVPLRARNRRRFGRLHLEPVPSGALGAFDRALVEQLAGLAGAAYEKLILYRTVREQAAALERRVEERTAELERTNRELEAFIYTVSHDLRAPLRAIDGFSAAIEEDFGDLLAGTEGIEAARYLQRVRAAARRMGHLIDDLLALSRVGRTSLRFMRVDLSAMAREIVSELRSRDPERRVEVEIENGLEATADANLIRTALTNLLENAWKYTAPREVAHIAFSQEVTAGGERAFGVRDDGIGFDPRYARELFEPFRRLHDAEAFEGAGIGLAAVKRIVERHGGWIRAEAEPGRGAVFSFTLEGSSVDVERSSIGSNVVTSPAPSVEGAGG